MLSLPDNQITYYLHPQITRLDQPKKFEPMAPKAANDWLFVLAPLHVAEKLARQGETREIARCSQINSYLTERDRLVFLSFKRSETARRTARATPRNSNNGARSFLAQVLIHSHFQFAGLRMSRPLNLISLVLPIFNEEEVLPLLLARLDQLLRRLPCPTEVVFVNDGSRDRTASLLEAAAASRPHLKVIEFSRNFGHQTAITAGTDFASGDVVVIMDGDLQDPPELVLDMIQKYQEGFDVVYARERAARRNLVQAFQRPAFTG